VAVHRRVMIQLWVRKLLEVASQLRRMLPHIIRQNIQQESGVASWQIRRLDDMQHGEPVRPNGFPLNGNRQPRA
jgi:hypothetical protein